MIILFAIIGAKLEVGFWYWLVFGLMCGIRFIKAFED